MKVYILGALTELFAYQKIGYIDEAESILWIKRYNDVGECEIYTPCSSEMIELLKKGRYIYREDDDMLCKIESVEIKTSIENGDYIIATGEDVANILSGRIVAAPFVFNGRVFDFIKKLIGTNITAITLKNRRIDNFSFYTGNEKEFTETIQTSVFAKDLLELIKATCKAYNYGFKIKYLADTKTLEFVLYKGKNKATTESDYYIEFSPAFSNIISSNYKEDESNHKNICYVGYKGEDESVKLLPVFIGEEPAGENRKEIYVDGTSVNRDITIDELKILFPKVSDEEGVWKDNGIIVAHTNQTDLDKVIITDYTYEMILKNLGYNTLAERARTEEFSGEVDTLDTYEYKVDYDIGDIVKVMNEYGKTANARIIEITESDDGDNGYQVEPKFEYID